MSFGILVPFYLYKRVFIVKKVLEKDIPFKINYLVVTEGVDEKQKENDNRSVVELLFPLIQHDPISNTLAVHATAATVNSSACSLVALVFSIGRYLANAVSSNLAVICMALFSSFFYWRLLTRKYLEGPIQPKNKKKKHKSNKHKVSKDQKKEEKQEPNLSLQIDKRAKELNPELFCSKTSG